MNLFFLFYKMILIDCSKTQRDINPEYRMFVVYVVFEKLSCCKKNAN